MKKAAPLLLSLAVGASAAHVQSATINGGTHAASASLYGSLLMQGRSTLTVRLYGPSRSPLYDIHVELLNDTYSTIRRGRTDGAGRISFLGLPDGTYKVRVLAYGTEYLEQMQDVTIASISQLPSDFGGGGGTNEHIDIYLKARDSGSGSPFAAPPGTVFAQVVPEEAKKLFERGVGELRDKKEKEGFQSLKQSLEVFPNYYLALERLGTEYVTRGTASNGYYEAARILLTKALEVNPKGFPSTFGLGIAQYQLKMTDQAVETLKRSTTLYANSVNAYMWLGMALKQAKRTDEAEAAFKRANAVSNGKAAEVHWQLARLYSEQNRYQEAADALELYLKFRTDKNDTEKVRQMIAQLREKAAKK